VRELDIGSQDLADQSSSHEWATRHRRLYGQKMNDEDDESVERSLQVLSRTLKKRVTMRRLSKAMENPEVPNAEQDGVGIRRSATVTSWLSQGTEASIAFESSGSPQAAWEPPRPPLPPTSPIYAVPQSLRQEQLPGAVATDFDAENGSEGSEIAIGVKRSDQDHPSIENVASNARASAQLEGEPASAVLLRPRRDSVLQYFFDEMRQTTTESSSRVKRLSSGSQALESCGHVLKALVRSSKFEGFVCVLILLNALVLGLQTDYAAKADDSHEVPKIYSILEAVFCVIFVLEIIARTYTLRFAFFYKGGWAWNIFDLTVVSIQVIEQFMSFLEASSTRDVLGNLSTTRIIRILRLIRVMRLARILQGISELRILVLSILSSVRSMFWTVVLILLIIYTFSLFITQMVADHRKVFHLPLDLDSSLHLHFGSLGATMLSLFMSITGGVDWQDVCRPLMEIWPWMAIIFTAYISFAVLMMLNTVTGVFVESVLQSQARDRDAFMVSNARELFQGLEGGLHAQMGWEMFQSKATSPQMQEFFKAIDVEPSEAKCLFDLLDLDNSGEISADEFLSGAMRLRGPAKALDLAVLVNEVRQIDKQLRALSRM